jgi:hypothetical protein
MSFFELDNNQNTISEKIKYIYTGTSVNKRDITQHSNDEQFNSLKKTGLPEPEGNRIPVKNTFYKINFANREPNFIYAGMNPSSYVATTMYLYGLLHRNISGITSKTNTGIIGEIVIEHANANKQTQKVYTCFLVEEQSDKSTNNSVDTLVNMVTGEGSEPDITVELNSIIPKQKRCVHYVDGDNHVFLFTIPLQVNKTAADFFRNKLATETKLLKVYPPVDYEVIALDKDVASKEGFTVREGLDGEIYIDCQPTGESDDTIAVQIGKFVFINNITFWVINVVLLLIFVIPVYNYHVVGRLADIYKDKCAIHVKYLSIWIAILFTVSVAEAFHLGTMDTAQHTWIFEYGIWLAASGMLAAVIVSFGGAACLGKGTDNAGIVDWFKFIPDFYFKKMGDVGMGFYLFMMLLSVGIIIANWAGSGLGDITTVIFRVVSVICFVVFPMLYYWLNNLGNAPGGAGGGTAVAGP